MEDSNGRIMPPRGHEAALYRLVLDHGDFGIHNMSIATDAGGRPHITSLYDWETGCILPALLSDPHGCGCQPRL